jgi:aryl-alcohol dehydrogenase-like predicted oxidoreductase
MDDAGGLARRPLGRTGLEVTPLALASGAVRGAAPKGPALTADDVEGAYHEHGINAFFVVSFSEPMVAGVRRLIDAGHRDDLVLISMASLPFGWSVRRAWAKQARMLGVETIDVFLLGWIQGRWYLSGRTWPAMRRLREEGKVRAIGWSTHKRGLATRLAREYDPDVMMIRYNAAHRGAETDIFEPLGDACPAIIDYTATRWGRLLLPVPEAGFDAGLSASECYRFGLSHPAVDTVLCAARSAEEIREDVRGVRQGPLEADRMREVRAFGDAVHAQARGGQRWMFR